MRWVAKLAGGGFHLSQAHLNPPRTREQATSRWGSFGHKSAVMTSLLHEQYKLCCYSEVRADEEGIGYHIEHVENKSQAPGRTFEYTNLAASAIASEFLANLARADQFGGHAQGKVIGVDIAIFVSCHTQGCGSYFNFLSDGRMVPARDLSQADRLRAEYSIDLLNLNCGFLVNRRRSWWEELDALLMEHEDNGWDIESLAAIDLIPSGAVEPKLSRFYSLTRQFYGRHAEQAISNLAPNML